MEIYNNNNYFFSYHRYIIITSLYIKRKMTCKGICQRHKALRPRNGKRYLLGQKRCQTCDIFIEWHNIWCPCCGYRLRVKPRNGKFKSIL
jgi:hypothetical protein